MITNMSKHKKDAKKTPKSKKASEERVDKETISYYRRVSETFLEGFPGNEEKDLFLNNVFMQLESDGNSVCKLATISKVLEDLIKDVNAHHTVLLFKAFSNDWPMMLTDRCASHVLQQLISQIPRCLSCDKNSPTEDDAEDDDSIRDSMIESFLSFCEFLSENLEEYFTDVYASHIIRVILEVLGGTSVDDNVIRSRLSRNVKKDVKEDVTFPSYIPSEDFIKWLKKICKMIFHLDNIKVYVCDRNCCPVLQTMLLVLHKAPGLKKKLCQKYIRKIVDLMSLHEKSESQSLPVMVKDQAGSYMVEQILNLGSEDVYTELYKNVFKGSLHQFAVHPVANFILQRLISNVKEKEHFEEIFEELCVHLEDILAMDHFGLITRLADGCSRLGCKQEKLVRSLMTAFHCVEPVERQIKLAPLLLSLNTYEMFFKLEDDGESKDKEKEEKQENEIPLLTNVNYHGSLLVQQLLRFGNPRLLVNSLAELKPSELKVLSCNPCGSHVIDAYFQSSSIGEKGRELLINRLKGTFKDLAFSKNGSRSLESIWKVANVKQKTLIASNLSNHEAKLRGDNYGRFIHKNFALFHFINRRSEWNELQKSDIKKRKLFKDLLEDSAAVPTKKQRKTNVDEDDNDDDKLDDGSLRLDEDESDEVISKNFRSKTERTQQPTLTKAHKKKAKHDKKHAVHRIKDKSMKQLLKQIEHV